MFVKRWLGRGRGRGGEEEERRRERGMKGGTWIRRGGWGKGWGVKEEGRVGKGWRRRAGEEDKGWR